MPCALHWAATACRVASRPPWCCWRGACGGSVRATRSGAVRPPCCWLRPKATCCWAMLPTASPPARVPGTTRPCSWRDRPCASPPPPTRSDCRRHRGCCSPASICWTTATAKASGPRRRPCTCPCLRAAMASTSSRLGRGTSLLKRTSPSDTFRMPGSMPRRLGGSSGSSAVNARRPPSFSCSATRTWHSTRRAKPRFVPRRRWTCLWCWASARARSWR
mmetsp:Transcript_34602/g.92045  ORF Transcript_34602/g.92045 Transcript_34602/m.92045 type:complete len:219 (-) Transcript_34602:579-1235(-)